MHPFHQIALAASALAAMSCASAQITLYEHDGFQGRNFSTTRGVDDFTREGFNDRASSIVVESDRWQVCQDAGYAGRCVELRAGRYPSLAAVGLNDRISSVRYLGAEVRQTNASQRGAAQITFYQNDGFQGRSFSTERGMDNFTNQGFNDRASSIVIDQGLWQVCDGVGYAGRCAELKPGRYPSLTAMGLNDRISSVRYLGAEQQQNNASQRGGAQITLYQNDGFQGRSFSTERGMDNFTNQGFNDRASSIVIDQGLWQVCDGVGYAGRCAELRPGRYPSLTAMGLNDRISSVRYLGAAPPVAASADYRRRGNERLYEANVTSVHAVMATPERKCWIEREQVAPEHSDNRIPGALVGALLGGVLGHQVGGGTGKSVATVGGAVAGGALGAHLGGQSGEQTSGTTRDVERCSTAQASNRPDYWDVTYAFRGTEHRMQMTSAPGPTVTVNRQGEPRTQLLVQTH